MKKNNNKQEFLNDSFEPKPFLLYRGVVEDNKDPDKIQRVKVRIFGIHTEKNENSGDDFEYVKTSELPWAEVIGGTGFGLISGVGLTSVLRQGTWVWVILENDDPNKPIVIGTINGINSTSSSGKYSSGEGFFDPDEVYPKSSRSSRSDIHPNADSNYPDIAILETQSGHIIEIDDTAGSEKISVTHKIGTSFSIDNEGNLTLTINKDLTINVTGDININATNVATTTSENQTYVGARIDLNP